MEVLGRWRWDYLSPVSKAVNRKVTSILTAPAVLRRGGRLHGEVHLSAAWLKNAITLFALCTLETASTNFYDCVTGGKFVRAEKSEEGERDATKSQGSKTTAGTDGRRASEVVLSDARQYL